MRVKTRVVIQFFQRTKTYFIWR